MKESASGASGLCSTLFVVFLVLKLCDQIDWSWWWVTAPLWIPACVVLAIVGALIAGAVWKESDSPRGRQ